MSENYCDFAVRPSCGGLSMLGKLIDRRTTDGQQAISTKFFKEPKNLRKRVDKVNNHFQLLMQAWKGNDYIFQCFLHLDIIDGKTWIQWNETAFLIEEDLLKIDVSNQEIVLGVKVLNIENILILL